jgi:hypothetical protein
VENDGLGYTNGFRYMKVWDTLTVQRWRCALVMGQMLQPRVTIPVPGRESERISLQVLGYWGAASFAAWQLVRGGVVQCSGGGRDGVGFRVLGHGAGAVGGAHAGSVPCLPVAQGEVPPGEHYHRHQPPQQAGVGEQHHECAWIPPLSLSTLCFVNYQFLGHRFGASEMAHMSKVLVLVAVLSSFHAS